MSSTPRPRLESDPLTAERVLDDADADIVRALQDNARASFAELGRKIGLSAPAITERLRKLESDGIIAGYHARVNSAKLGYAVTAYLRLRTSRQHYQRIISLARVTQDVRECHHTSGEGVFLMKIITSTQEQFERTVELFRPFGEMETTVILSTPVEKYST